MLVDTDDLAAIGDLAARYGVTHQRMNFYAKKDTFPAPLVILSGGKVYSRFAVDEWMHLYRQQLAAKKLARELA